MGQARVALAVGVLLVAVGMAIGSGRDGTVDLRQIAANQLGVAEHLADLGHRPLAQARRVVLGLGDDLIGAPLGLSRYGTRIGLRLLAGTPADLAR